MTRPITDAIDCLSDGRDVSYDVSCENHLEQLCMAVRNHRYMFPGIYIVADFHKKEYLLLSSDQKLFYHQSEEARDYLNAKFQIYDDFILNDESRMQILRDKIVDEYKANHQFCAFGIIDVRMKGRRMPYSMFLKADFIFNQQKEMYGVFCRIDKAYKGGENIIMLYDENNYTGIVFDRNGECHEKNFYHLKEGDIEMLDMRNDGIVEDDIALIMEMNPHTVESHIKSLRRKYEVPTTHALLTKLKMLGIL